jgi:hypothetical protein
LSQNGGKGRSRYLLRSFCQCCSNTCLTEKRAFECYRHW